MRKAPGPDTPRPIRVSSVPSTMSHPWGPVMDRARGLVATKRKCGMGSRMAAPAPSELTSPMQQ